MASLIDKVYPDYASAMAECGHGYNDPDIAKVVAFRTSKWSSQLENRRMAFDQITTAIIAVSVASTNLKNGAALRVLDFGGGCGMHYFSVRYTLDVPLQWAIVETPPMASFANSAGAGLFKAFAEIGPAASFLGQVDLVIASGVINYTPDPLSSLGALLSLRASYFVLARLPIWQGETMIGVQASSLTDHLSGFVPDFPPGIINRPVKQPFTLVNADRVTAKLKTSYRMLLSLPSPSADLLVRGDKVLGRSFILGQVS